MQINLTGVMVACCSSYTSSPFSHLHLWIRIQFKLSLNHDIQFPHQAPSLRYWKVTENVRERAVTPHGVFSGIHSHITKWKTLDLQVRFNTTNQPPPQNPIHANLTRPQFLFSIPFFLIFLPFLFPIGHWDCKTLPFFPTQQLLCFNLFAFSDSNFCRLYRHDNVRTAKGHKSLGASTATVFQTIIWGLPGVLSMPNFPTNYSQDLCCA